MNRLTLLLILLFAGCREKSVTTKIELVSKEEQYRQLLEKTFNECKIADEEDEKFTKAMTEWIEANVDDPFDVTYLVKSYSRCRRDGDKITKVYVKVRITNQQYIKKLHEFHFSFHFGKFFSGWEPKKCKNME